MISILLTNLAESRNVLELSAFDACVHEEANVLKNQMTGVDSVVELVFCKIMHALKAGFRELHGFGPRLGHFLNICLLPRCHYR